MLACSIDPLPCPVCLDQRSTKYMMMPASSVTLHPMTMLRSCSVCLGVERPRLPQESHVLVRQQLIRGILVHEVGATLLELLRKL